MNPSPTAITGIGVVSPLGIGVRPFEASLRESRCAIEKIDRFDTSARSSHRGALVRDFRPEDFIDPNRLRRMDPLSAQAVAAAHLAVQDAGLSEYSRSTPTKSTGVTFGSAYGCQSTTWRYAQKLVEQGGYFTNPIDFPDSVDGAPAAHIAMELGLQGPSTTHVDGALSGEIALWHASLAIQAGRAERMLVGSADQLTDALHGVLDELGVLCCPDERGEELMCPYDARRRGSVPGEGAAVVVLENASVARERGARNYASILGFGHGSDPGCLPYRFPEKPASLLASMRAALTAAELSAEQIDLFSGAAASLPGMDEVELAAANELFASAHSCSLVALKAAFGDFEAAGVLRVAGACLALHEGFAPGALGLATPEPATLLRFEPRAREARLSRAVHHGFTRGGQSLSIVFGSV